MRSDSSRSACSERLDIHILLELRRSIVSVNITAFVTNKRHRCRGWIWKTSYVRDSRSQATALTWIYLLLYHVPRVEEASASLMCAFVIFGFSISTEAPRAAKRFRTETACRLNQPAQGTCPPRSAAETKPMSASTDVA